MRDAARKIIRRVGVETGGSNIQFAVNPADGRMIVIEMNPRVSRSSALASKATGFPIAKIAAKLALGYHLDEIPERHHAADAGLVRAHHRLRRREDPAVELREVPRGRSDADDADEVGGRGDGDRAHVQRGVPEGDPLARAGPDRPAVRRRSPRATSSTKPRCARSSSCRPTAGCGRVFEALERGWSIDDLHDLTKIDPWFLRQFADIVGVEEDGGAVGPRRTCPRTCCCR